jgi:hypothetical protein
MKMTPDVVDNVIQAMIREDKSDDYFSKNAKNAAIKIDISQAVTSYNNSLMAQISTENSLPNSLILNLIHELALNRLIYGEGKSPIEEYGGWYPQRLPWNTARILIALRYSGIEGRKDNEHILNVINDAITFLIRSIYQNKYWRSGVGDWYTYWESTALCLEALFEWDKIIVNEKKLLPVLRYILTNEDKWLVSPSFESKKQSDETLAAAILASITILIVNKCYTDKFALNYEKYLQYLNKVLDTIEITKTFTVKQSGTIPQILFYIANLALKLNK